MQQRFSTGSTDISSNLCLIRKEYVLLGRNISKVLSQHSNVGQTQNRLHVTYVSQLPLYSQHLTRVQKSHYIPMYLRNTHTGFIVPTSKRKKHKANNRLRISQKEFLADILLLTHGSFLSLAFFFVMKFPKLRDRISSRGTGPVLFDISSLNTGTDCDNAYSSSTARRRRNQRVFGVGGEVRF